MGSMTKYIDLIRPLSNKEFVKEMRILWQNLSVAKRCQFCNLIRNYFDEGNRAEGIIGKLQEKICEHIFLYNFYPLTYLQVQ